MILVDTSVWVDHFRSGNIELARLLKNFQVLTHPFIIGELACGNLRNRKKILALLNDLPQAALAQHKEVLELIESHKLMGQGVGWVDVHLLAATLLSGVPLWTADRNLRTQAAILSVLY